MAQHDGHDFTMERDAEGDADSAWWFCLSCGMYVSEVTWCGEPTRTGLACQIAVRDDLGYTTCRQHSKAKKARP